MSLLRLLPGSDLGVRLRKRMDSLDLRAQLSDLQDQSEYSSPQDRRQRGRRFEEFLRALLEREALDPRIRIRPSGEELDGSLILDGRVFLIEAKWHANAIPASSIYAFKGKVDGKLVGTIGLFVSMSGYSSEAVDALTSGKTINVLLFDGNDIESCLTIEDGFSLALRAKLRAAADEGLVFFPYRSEQITHKSGERNSAVQSITSTVRTDAVSAGQGQELVVVCEGMTDRSILGHLATRILQQEGRTATLRMVSALGKLPLPHLANALRKELSFPAEFLIVADADGDVDGTTSYIESELEKDGVQLIVVEPTLEAWLLPDAADPQRKLRAIHRQIGASTILRTAEQLADEIDLQDLQERHESFSQYYRFIVASSQNV